MYILFDDQDLRYFVRNLTMTLGPKTYLACMRKVILSNLNIEDDILIWNILLSLKRLNHWNIL